MDVDFVITWVDMNDAQWQADFAACAGDKGYARNSVSATRFRDYGLLRYWFRGVETFAPWVRKIHFITCGQTPDWLQTDHPKLHLVRHEDFIPKEFLPTFNSAVIERYIHRIDGLAEHFVYFNDDFYLTRHVPLERFFQGGLPCDIAAQQYSPAWSQWYIRIRNNVRLINKHFVKRGVLARDHAKWFHKSYGHRLLWNYLLRPSRRFITLCTPHNAQPYLKSTFTDVWQAEGEELTRTSANRFRANDDYTPELFRMWQICSGRFAPYNTYSDTKMFPLMLRPQRAIRAIREQRYRLVCLNDNKRIRRFDEVMTQLRAAFQHILPHPSRFERDCHHE